MIISASNIGVTIGNSQILKDVSILAQNQKFIGVIGPNGSGKSTFLKCVYRVLKPNGGTILLDGENLNRLSYKESAKRMSVVAQHNFYNFDFSVEEVVLLGRSPHKGAMEQDNAADYAIVRAALETVGMTAFQKRSFSTLSGGEQQRIILARALAQKAHCLILDEPTNHLDIKYQLQLLDIVKGLHITVICAIHDLNIASMYCDYLYVLDGGAVVAEGETGRVLTKELIRQVYEVDATVYTDALGVSHILYQPLYDAREQNDQSRNTANCNAAVGV